MRFLTPEWFVLLPLLAWATWRWPHLHLRAPLRVTCLVLIVLVLMRPEIRRLGRGLDLWVLLDRSSSAAALIEPRLSEWETLLSRSKTGDDRIFYVDYADETFLRDEGNNIRFLGSREFTRTRSAVQFALSRMARDRAARLLLLTDGFSTEPLAGLGERLLDQQVPLDVRLVSEPEVNDARITRFELPPKAQVGEPFLLQFRAVSSRDGPMPFELLRDGSLLTQGSVDVRKGSAFVRFTDRSNAPGAHQYTARLLPAEDTHPGNNLAEQWIEIAGGPRLLVVTAYTEDPLVVALRAQGFAVDEVAELGTLNAGRLTGASAVILNNVPAYGLPADFVGALDFYVRGQGGGLLMIGGKNSFGSGGYFGSAIEELLPVSMELRQEHRKLAVAMVIALDRSGSMAAGVGGAAAGVTKMDLADEGAARAIELLGAQDAVAVLSVDTVAHPVVPLSLVGAKRDKLTNPVRRITSGGGGIFVFTALKAAYEELQKAVQGQRHVVLFADAADAEEPGEYKALLEKMTAEGITISTIGLGSDADPDADFLKDVAARGKGRVFFNADPGELPALFAQETVAVARSAFIHEPVALTPTAGWNEIAARPLQWLDSVDGYNLSYLKPDATAAAFSQDAYAAPMVAFWQRGAGRVGAVSFPLGGEFSQNARNWNQYGDFVQTLARWLMREELPAGLGLRAQVDGTELKVDLLYDDTWAEKLAQHPPKIVLAEGDSGTVRDLVWERFAPGHYKSSARLPPGEWMRGGVQAGGAALPFGPLIAGPGVEWAFDRDRITELLNVSRLSGGGERLDLTKIWDAPRRSAFDDVRPALLVALLTVFLSELITTRLNWQRPEFARSPPMGRKAQRNRQTQSDSIPPPSPRPPEAPATAAPPAADEAARRRRAIFEQAKRGGG